VVREPGLVPLLNLRKIFLEFTKPIRYKNIKCLFYFSKVQNPLPSAYTRIITCNSKNRLCILSIWYHTLRYSTKIMGISGCPTTWDTAYLCPETISEREGWRHPSFASPFLVWSHSEGTPAGVILHALQRKGSQPLTCPAEEGLSAPDMPCRGRARGPWHALQRKGSRPLTCPAEEGLEAPDMPCRGRALGRTPLLPIIQGEMLHVSSGESVRRNCYLLPHTSHQSSCCLLQKNIDRGLKMCPHSTQNPVDKTQTTFHYLS
jgi:hypothetical protein